MDFRILGPLEVRDGDREVRLRGGKQRALLALLLVNANRTLAIDRIVDELWGEDVPETAQKMVQIYVSQLRKVLPAGSLHTRPPGYALALEQEQLDLHRFESLVAAARAALDAGRAQEAADGFRNALALWRGPALAEFASEPFAQPEGARLEDLRVYALEGRLEADLQLGRHNDVAGELEALGARRPPSTKRQPSRRRPWSSATTPSRARRAARNGWSRPTSGSWRLCSSPTSSMRLRSRPSRIRSGRGRSSIASTRRWRKRSRPRAARSRSSRAMPSWPHSAPRPRRRITPNVRSMQPSGCGT